MDPIEERGGVNLYGFVGNDAIGNWDLLGLKYPKSFDSIKHPPDPETEISKDCWNCACWFTFKFKGLDDKAIQGEIDEWMKSFDGSFWDPRTGKFGEPDKVVPNDVVNKFGTAMNLECQKIDESCNYNAFALGFQLLVNFMEKYCSCELVED